MKIAFRLCPWITICLFTLGKHALIDEKKANESFCTVQHLDLRSQNGTLPPLRGEVTLSNLVTVVHKLDGLSVDHDRFTTIRKR